MLDCSQNTNTEQTSAYYGYRNSGVLKNRGLILWAMQSQKLGQQFFVSYTGRYTDNCQETCCENTTTWCPHLTGFLMIVLY